MNRFYRLFARVLRKAFHTRSLENHKETEKRLIEHYQEIKHNAGNPPDLWNRIELRLASNGEPVQSTKPASRIHRKPGKWFLRGAAGVTALFCLLAGTLYFAPRLEVNALAMLRGSKKVNTHITGALRDDPGLLKAWHSGDFRPVNLSSRVNGIKLDIVDFYTDANRTVVVYHISSSAKPQNQGLVMQDWHIVQNNATKVSQAMQTGQQSVTNLKNFPIYLKDQFGTRLSMRSGSEEGDGYGYLEFPSISGVKKSMGLRYTLHVSGMQAIFAPNGKFGKKQIAIRKGPWNISFIALPEQTPELKLTPNISASKSMGIFTLNAVRTANGSTQLLIIGRHLKFEGKSHRIPMLHFDIVTPDGRHVRPTNSSSNGERWMLNCPPLKSKGTYLLTISEGGYKWNIRWAQPAWSGQKQKNQYSVSLPLYIYSGKDFGKAAHLLYFPAYSPPKQDQVENIQVTRENGPVLTSHTEGTSLGISMKLRMPNGKSVRINQSRSFLTVVPPSESLHEFLRSLHSPKIRNNNIQSFRSFSIAGIHGQAWKIKSQNINGKKKVTKTAWVLFCYPKWGSIEISSNPFKHPATLAELKQLAGQLLGK